MAASTRTVRVKFDGDAKGLNQAAKDGEAAVDRFGKNTEKKFRQSGEKASKSFGSGMKSWFKGEGGGLFAELGKSGGTVFGSGLLGALKTPILGPALLATFAALAATVLPAAGAVAAGGLVAGFGAGLAGLGIVFAAKSEQVQAKWRTTLGQLGSDMRLLSRPFESTLINIAGYFQRTVDKFNPHLARAFASMAPVVDRFANGLLRSFERMAPAIAPITGAFEKVLDSLGPAFDSLIGDLAAGLTDLANSVARNPKALADMVAGLGQVTRTALQFITVLNNINGSFTTLTGGTSLVSVVMKGLQATMMPLLTLFTGVSKIVDVMNAALGKTGKDSATAGQSMSDAARQTALLAQGITSTSTAAQNGAAPMRTLAERMEAAKQKAQAQAAAFEATIASMFRLQNLALGLSGAQINLQSAMDSATASVKENGRTLDINSEKGRANRTALNGVAQAANGQTEAMIRSGASTSSAGLAAERSRANFVKIAMQMGLSRAQANAMAKSMIAIPNVSREARLTANKADLDRKLVAARAALNDKNLTKERRAQLNAEISQLLAKKAQAQSAINSLQGKTVTMNVVTRYSSTGVNLTAPSSVGRRASGGLTQPKRRYVLGERGPEIAEFGGAGTGGPRILSAERSRRELAVPAAPPMTAEIHIEIGSEVVRVVRSEIRADNRDLKRRVGNR